MNTQQVSKYFSQADKIKLYKQLEKNTAVGLVLALDMFDEFLKKMVEKKTAEFKEILAGMDKQIESKKLKDGKTPEAGTDYPSAKQIFDFIVENVSKIEPRGLTSEQIAGMIAHIRRMIGPIKSGKTPKAGIDYPTHEQMRQFIVSITSLPEVKTEINTKVTKNSEENNALVTLNSKYYELEKILRSLQRGNRSRSKRVGSGDSVIAGANVTVVRVGGRKQINAPGGSGTQIYEEVPTGSGTSFALAHTPTSGTLRLYRGGARQQLGGDYTLVGANITLSITLAVGEILVADYSY